MQRWCHPATATARAFLKPRPLSVILRACHEPHRSAHTTSSASQQPPNTPPPLTATSLNRHGVAHRKFAARQTPPTNGAVTLSASTAQVASAPSWTDVLGTHTAAAAPSRVALSEAAALCLGVESPKCYAVYRPCDSDEGTAPSSRRCAHAAPHHFVELLRHMRTAPNLSTEARRVAEVLVDLLNKAPHPHYPGPWDVTPHETYVLKASAIAHTMECIPAGDEALAWLVGLLGLSDTLAEPNAASHEDVQQPSTLLKLAVVERIDSPDATTTRRIHVEDPDGDALLSSSSTVVGAIAAAMLRSAADDVKSAALELLEASALSRLTRGSSSAAVVAATHSTAADCAEAAVLFNESVAVHCAEVAAVRGDVETVTRLIFLLYRARGALGFATLAEHRQQRRTSYSSRDGKQWWGVGGLLPRTPSWMRSTWRGGGASLQETDVTDDDDADVRFEQAVVRLLKSVMHAALYRPLRCGDFVGGSVEEALSLWDGLRGGTSWPGQAAMATELLTYLVDQHEHLTAAGVGRDDGRTTDGYLQAAGLRVYTQFSRAAPSRHRTSAQQEVLHHCVTLMMRLLSANVSISVEKDAAPGRSAQTFVAVPTVLTNTAAEHVLRLFAHVSDSTHQETLLPYALAASLAVLSTATMHKGYHPSLAFFSGLARYFSEAQSLHFYCVAPGDTTAAFRHVAVCGSLILLHVFLLSLAPLGTWAREDGDLWSFVQRLGRLADGVGEPGSDLHRQHHHDERRAQLLSWLHVSASLQRHLLWSLLMSLKQRDASVWCGAALNLFSSPASSAAVFAAAAAVQPSFTQAELPAVLSLLYKCGNTDDPVHSCATLDRVVTAVVQMPIHTLTLSALSEQVQRKSAAGIKTAVFVLTGASLRVIAEQQQQQRIPVCDSNVHDDGVAELVHLLLPLLRESAKHAAPSFVFVVLTPACLMELRRLQVQNAAVSRHSASGAVEGLHAALTGTAAHQLYHVVVASSWPLLPPLASALTQHGDLSDAVDGLREATAAARHFEHASPKEARPVVCLWAEEETPPATPRPHSATRVDLLQHYGVREVSAYRAHIKKAKNDIFSLLRSSSLADAHQHDLRVSADGAATESNAARRVRNTSLLSAVCQKRKSRRTL